MRLAVARTDVASPHFSSHFSPHFSPQFEQSCDPSGKAAPQPLQARVSILSFQADGNCNHRSGVENRGNS